MARNKHASHQGRPNDPIDVDVTEIRSEANDALIKRIQGRGLYLGFGFPWFTIRAFIGQREGFALTAGFKVDFRLLPGRFARQTSPPDPFFRPDPWE
jgi:hypothetical protein